VSGTVGCASRGGAPAADETGTDRQTSTVEATADETGTDRQTSTVEATAYESLSDDGRALFRRLLREGPVERADDRVPDGLLEADHVRYEGDVYAVSKSGAGIIHTFVLKATEVDADEVGGADAVRYADLSEAAATVFDEALVGGGPHRQGATTSGGVGRHVVSAPRRIVLPAPPLHPGPAGLAAVREDGRRLGRERPVSAVGRVSSRWS
jgi:hypothetical protein